MLRKPFAISCYPKTAASTISNSEMDERKAKASNSNFNEQMKLYHQQLATEEALLIMSVRNRIQNLMWTQLLKGTKTLIVQAQHSPTSVNIAKTNHCI